MGDSRQTPQSAAGKMGAQPNRDQPRDGQDIDRRKMGSQPNRDETTAEDLADDEDQNRSD